MMMKKEVFATEVTLEQILNAREERTGRQFAVSKKYPGSVLCFTMNIPGPVKDTPLIRRAFRVGLMELDRTIPREKILHREIREEVTGCEGTFSIDLEPSELKRRTIRIEDTHPLGRLFDMDVLDRDLNKLDRDTVGGQDRGCMVCGAPGRGCASRRIHSVGELQIAVQQMLIGYFRDHPDFHTVGTWAALSLLDEVSVTPKPGLVDRANSGSHRDMTLSTFVSSTAALVPYFRDCVRIGWDTRQDSPETAFRLLRQAGKKAEEAMYLATSGVNTHKGAIFTMGILCGAAGRSWDSGFDSLLTVAGSMTRDAMEADFRNMDSSTAGGRLFLLHGIRGIRGEAADGFPALRETGLPVFRRCLSEGLCWNDAGMVTLLHLIARVEDTNMIARGGMDLAAEARRWAAELRNTPTREMISQLDARFIRNHLSPGGCADLLAAVCFLHRLIRY